MQFRMAPCWQIQLAEAAKHVTEVHGWEHLLANLFSYFLFIRTVELAERRPQSSETSRVGGEKQNKKTLTPKLVFQSRSFSIKWHHYAGQTNW